MRLGTHFATVTQLKIRIKSIWHSQLTSFLAIIRLVDEETLGLC